MEKYLPIVTVDENPSYPLSKDTRYNPEIRAGLLINGYEDLIIETRLANLGNANPKLASTLAWKLARSRSGLFETKHSRPSSFEPRLIETIRVNTKSDNKSVKELRKGMKLTQEQLAYKAGIKLSTLQKIERYDSLPLGTSIEVGLRLARTLNVPLESLVVLK